MSLGTVTLRSMSIAPWLEGLNAEQRRAAEAVAGPVCIIAGAGTGKTRTIAHRIAHQVHTQTAAASEVLAVTFTDKAAGELRHRLTALGLPAPVRAATFHAAAWAQLRWFWPRLDRGPLPGVLASKVRLLLGLARRTRTEVRDLAGEIEWAKARRLAPEDYAGAGRQGGPLPPEQMAEIFTAYEQAKADEGLIDYEDMLLLTTHLLESDAEVAAEVRDRYRHFTVDEFQDINAAQFALLRAWLGDRDDICVVGDEDQTIYSFTGASATYLINFSDHFPNAQHIALTSNYRSTPEVISLANNVLWTKPAARRKSLRATCDAGPPPAFREHDDDTTEVRAVVDDIAALLRADDVALGEIAVLYRVNSQSEPFEVALRDAGIPFAVRGEGGFYDQTEIRQALGVLAAAAQQPPAPPPLGLEDTVAAGPPDVVDTVRRVLRQQMGFDDRTEPSGRAARERWRNLVVLVDLAAREARENPVPDLAALAERLQARAGGGTDASGDAGAVTLTTLHRAKGTEYDAVFIVAAEEGLLPISHAKTEEEIEEERRLFYVGVTRARRQLTISWARRRPGYAGKIVSRRPSRLLYNLGPGAPRSAGRRAAAAPAVPTGTARRCACGRALAAGAERKRGSCWNCFSGGADPGLADRLRQWRKQRAAQDDVPAFVVFNDTTLAELARVRPTTPRSLLTITGLGPTKVSRYGDELLRVLEDAP